MKKIKLKKAYSLYRTIDISKESVDFETKTMTDLIDVARDNASKVLGAAQSIEHDLEKLIEFYLFSGVSTKNEAGFFSDKILRASFFNFSAKKQVSLSIIQDFHLLKGKEFSDLQKLLKDIMIARNALAHGEFIGDQNNNIVLLKYFSGEPQQITLSDDYWDELERIFTTADKLVDIAIKRIMTEMKSI